MKTLLSVTFVIAACASAALNAAETRGFGSIMVLAAAEGDHIVDVNGKSIQYSESQDCKNKDEPSACMALGFSFMPPPDAIAKGMNCSIKISGNPNEIPAMAQFPGGVVERRYEIPPEGVTTTTVLTAYLTRDAGDKGKVNVQFACASPNGAQARGKVDVVL